MQIISGSRLPIKAWIEGIELEEDAVQQLKDAANLPFAFKHLAVMPDCHWGMGCTIGTVIATRGAIVPAMVGVDIGCGMMAIQTPLYANDLPDNLSQLRSDIEKAVPHGRTNNGAQGDRGAWNDIPPNILNFITEKTNLVTEYEEIIKKHPLIMPKRVPWHHMATLGTGNHFIELCLDQNQSVWVMLHTGSRGIGNKIGMYFIEKAKEEMSRYYIDKFLPNKDLAYLVEHSEMFDDYILAVNWAQKFAQYNRIIMMQTIIKILKDKFPSPSNVYGHLGSAINCHHNYVARENHFGSNVLVTRKGAVRAREDDYGIIPGSMGTGSFIVKGKGNRESFHSCSHGAGRKMSRTQAKKIFTIEDHAKATEGIECRKDVEVLDETPGAYKDIGTVMKAQDDLVEVVYTLRQVLNIKG